MNIYYPFEKQQNLRCQTFRLDECGYCRMFPANESHRKNYGKKSDYRGITG